MQPGLMNYPMMGTEVQPPFGYKKPVGEAGNANQYSNACAKGSNILSELDTILDFKPNRMLNNN